MIASSTYAIRWSACETIAIEIAPEFVESVAGRDLDKWRLEIRPAFAVENTVVVHLASILAAEVRTGGPNGSLFGEGVSTALVAHLLRSQGAVLPQVRPGVRALSAGEFKRIKQYIDDQLEMGLSLRELADVLGMNVYRFVRSFTESAGLPPYRYVLQQRIERSKSLLADPEVPITEVACRLGFASQSHFSTAFRRFTSITPGRYRRAVR